MRKTAVAIIFVMIQYGVSASPFLTDLTPDYLFQMKPDYETDSSWNIYTGLNFTHLYQNTDSHFKDIQLNSGVLWTHESFSMNMGWKGSILDGQMLINGLDAVFEEGDRRIVSDHFYNGLQFGFDTEYLFFNLYTLGEEPFYRIGLQTPPFFGFYFLFRAERKTLFAFELDLVKNYSFNSMLSDFRFHPGLGWKNGFLEAELSFIQSQVLFSDSQITDNPIVLDLDCKSVYGMKAELSLKGLGVRLDSLFKQIHYEFFLTGRTNSTQFLMVESENTEDGHLDLIVRELVASLAFFDGKLRVGGFYQSFLIPNETVNRGFIDMDPLSPVGVIYRRKDIVEDFGFFYQQAGGQIGSKWAFPIFEVDGSIDVSYLSIRRVGTYHYMDGIVSFFPFPHWTNVNIFEDLDIAKVEKYLVFKPELSLMLKVKHFYLKSQISQLIPISLNSGLVEGFRSLTESDASGGFNASFLIGVGL